MIIYSLTSSIDPENVRYIGYTKKTPGKRLMEHISESKYRRTRKDKWIQKVIRNGGEVLIEEIESCDEIQLMKERECQWIKTFKALGARLTNGTMGGDGVVGNVISDAGKLRMSLANSKKIYVFDYQTRQLVSTFPSRASMIKSLNLPHSGVSDVIAGNAFYCKGYVFSYTDKCPTKKERINYPVWNKGISTKGKQKFKTRAVVALSEVARTRFDTVSEAAACFGVCHTYICKMMREGIYYKGYYMIPADQYDLMER